MYKKAFDRIHHLVMIKKKKTEKKRKASQQICNKGNYLILIEGNYKNPHITNVIFNSEKPNTFFLKSHQFY